MKVDRNIEIEDLVREYPSSVSFLSDKGIRCLRCGEPIWGTLGEAAEEKGFSGTQIEKMVKELLSFLDQKS